MAKLDFSLEIVEATINGRALKFYPLNFKALRVLSKELDVLRSGKADMAERMSGICEVLAASATCTGEQQISATELESILTPQIASAIMGEVNRISGFVKTADSSPSSEAPTVAPLNGASLTGAESTQQ